VATPGDYDGDGKADVAVYDTARGAWWMLRSSNGFNFGASYLTVVLGGSGMNAVPRDYDGDGKADVAVYRAATGDWSILESSTNYSSRIDVRWGGVPGDVPLGRARQ
jgi:hypothetical protein